METSFQLWGSEKKLPEQKILKAGALSAILENGSLRTISAGGTEIIRMVYSAVRTENWLTVEPEIVEEKIMPLHDGFTVLLKCRYLSDNTHFEAVYTITGRNDNTLFFTMDGLAKSTFKRCRIGFCVLHPLDGITGNQCTLIHPNGRTEQTVFPEFVNPTQPFFNLKGMKWDIDKLGTVELGLEGDVFETEDHRNWTDASFKTYCTPLNLPYPVEVKEGTAIRQAVSMKFTPAAPLETTQKNETVRIDIDLTKSCPLPELGLARTTHRKKLTSEEIKLLKQTGFNHYRVDVYTFQSGWKNELAEAISEAKELNVSLELAAFFDTNCVENAVEMAQILMKENVKIERIIVLHRTVFSTPAELWDEVKPAFFQHLSGVKIVAGTNANFAQLNRARPSFGDFDEISFSVQPQEHAFDNQSLVENIAAQFDVVKSAMQFSQGKPVIVSPLNIQRRFNANREHFEHPTPPGEMPWQVDARLLSMFGASWIAGSLATLARAGAASVTVLETVGERGIIQGDFQSRWPAKFPAEKGQLFPVFHIIKLFNRWKKENFRLLETKISDNLATGALFLQKQSKFEGLIFNFTNNEKQLEFTLPVEGFQIKTMSANEYGEMATNSTFTDISDKITYPENGIFQLILPPFGMAFFSA